MWDTIVADYKTGHSITVAPLAVKDKIVVGIAGGEYGVRGFLDAYDAKSGKRAWRFWTIPDRGGTRQRNLERRQLENRIRHHLGHGRL